MPESAMALMLSAWRMDDEPGIAKNGLVTVIHGGNYSSCRQFTAFCSLDEVNGNDESLTTIVLGIGSSVVETKVRSCPLITPSD